MVVDSLEIFSEAFRDEDPEIWIDAAIRIGRLGSVAVPFLQEHLSSTRNIHAHRHAWCTLASFAGNSQLVDDLVLDIVVGKQRDGTDLVETCHVKTWLKERVSSLMLEGLKDSCLSLTEVEHAVPQLGDIRLSAIQKLEESSYNSLGNNARNPEKKIHLLSMWRNDSTPINSIRLKSQKLPWDMWSFASFIAGASPQLFQSLGLSVKHFLVAMVSLADQGGDRLAFVVNLPRMLAAFGGVGN
ncbi:MAG: hypothetical protein WCO26_19590, partial [Deltaproteobacteria bacterium]